MLIRPPPSGSNASRSDAELAVEGTGARRMFGVARILCQSSGLLAALKSDSGRDRGPISPIRNPGNVNTEFHIRNVRSSSPDTPLTPEERDARTVFCMQLSQRCR